jgi:hypothetical protein
MAALPQVYELLRVTGIPASTQGRGRLLCRLRDQTYAIAYVFLNGGSSEIRVTITGGIACSRTEEIAAATGGNNLLYPCIAVDSRDNIHLCYRNDTLDRVFYVRRDHISDTWSAPYDIGNAAACTTPVLAVGPNDQVAFVWSQVMAGLGRVLYCERSYAGAWTVPVTMDNPAPAAGGHHDWPSVAFDTQGNLHVLTQAHGYGVNAGNYQPVYMRRNSDGTYGAQIAITDEASDRTAPSITVDLSNNIRAYCKENAVSRDIECYKKPLAAAAFELVESIKPALGLPSFNPSASEDQLPGQHVAFTSLVGGENFGIYISNQHYTCHWRNTHWQESNNGPWGIGHRFNLALTTDPSHPQLLWAMFPYINGVHTNYPLHGCAMAFSDDTALAVYLFTSAWYGAYGVTPCFEPNWDDTLVWGNTTPASESPEMETLPCSAIGQTSMMLNGRIIDDQCQPLDVCFEYGLAAVVMGADGTVSPWQNGKVTGDAFSYKLEGLTRGTTYLVRAKGKWPTGQLCYGNMISVTTRVPETVSRLQSATPFIGMTGGL